MKIAILGNAADLNIRKRGAMLDGCDRVVRCNSFRLRGCEEFVGTKVDIVSLCFAAAVVETALPHSSAEIGRASVIWTPYPRGYHSEDRVRATMDSLRGTDENPVYPEAFGAVEPIAHLFTSLIAHSVTVHPLREAMQFRPTTGLMTLEMTRCAFPNADLVIGGFGMERELSPTRFDSSGVQMWKYHDLEWERSVIGRGIQSGRWSIA